MKKGRILNPQLSHVVASMGHTDGIALADCGLPIPKGVERVDLAVSEGVPGFLQVLDVLLTELQVEKLVLAEEIKVNNPHILKEIICRLEGVEIEWVCHEDFKKLTAECKAVVRTGECSPYANVILKSGVIF